LNPPIDFLWLLQVEHHASFAEAWADLGTVRRFTGDFRGAADALQ
jgi:hypothetical protein